MPCASFHVDLPVPVRGSGLENGKVTIFHRYTSSPDDASIGIGNGAMQVSVQTSRAGLIQVCKAILAELEVE